MGSGFGGPANPFLSAFRCGLWWGLKFRCFSQTPNKTQEALQVILR